MLTTIVWVGFSQSLFAAILVAAKKNIQKQDRILATWLFLLAAEFLTCGIDYLVWGVPLLSSSFLLFNPAFFLYIRSLTKAGFKLKASQLLHLVPFIVFESASYLLEEKSTLHNFFENDSTQWFRFLFSIASVISWLVYNYLSAAMVFRHRKKLENEFSTIESEKKLKWIISIVVLYNLYCAFSLILGVIQVSVPGSGLSQYVYNYSALLVLIYILSFYGLRQERVFQTEENPLEEVKEKYQNSVLSTERKESIKEALIRLVESSKIYLNPDLNMNMLSEMLDVPKHQLTEVINSEIGKNFFRFINDYRVEAVKKKLLDPNNLYSIEAIGYDCGFNSKSSFFTVFKNVTGMTPLQYKMQNSKE
ncbi:MAG: helix-turn-helix domain-containing protein [Bacteroidales bacterium]|nr:helix-turn-helix domain-containing protein [Bacteroidales bacterium]MDY0215577.1 helix-turn-helix domain-containing protein [Bacteroidales bacterium]